MKRKMNAAFVEAQIYKLHQSRRGSGAAPPLMKPGTAKREDRRARMAVVAAATMGQRGAPRTANSAPSPGSVQAGAQVDLPCLMAIRKAR